MTGYEIPNLKRAVKAAPELEKLGITLPVTDFREGEVVMLRTAWKRLLFPWRGKESERDLDEELRFHLEKQIEDNVKAGMSPKEARRTALRSFGGIEHIKEECRDARGIRFIEEFWQDLRYGARILRRSPGFTAVAVLSVTLGIGVNTAVFGLIDMLVFRPFPVREPGRLAVFTPAFSNPDYQHYRDRNEVFTGVMAYRRLDFRLTNGANTEMVQGESVSANYFALLGLELQKGRSFLPEEDEAPGSHPVAILSYALWQHRFESDPSILGKTVKLNGESLMIVGVAPKSYRGMELYGLPTDIWIPISMVEEVMHFKNDPHWHDVLHRREARWLGLMGRLKPGISLEQARASIAVLARQLEAASEKPNPGSRVTLSALGIRIPPKSLRFSLAVLTTVTGFVLLMVCANIANLLVARAHVRQREIAIRLALGAPRARLVRQLLAESAVLSGIGMALGLFVAIWTVQWLSQIGAPLNLENLDFDLDPRVFGLALMISLLTCIAFGLGPALQASGLDLRSTLQHAGSAFGPSRTSRIRQSLVVSQVATSVVLLISGGILLRSLWNLQSIDPGFKSENIAILSVDLNFLRHGYDESKGMHLYREVLERVRSLPGVRSLAWAGDAPLTPIHHRESFVHADLPTTGQNDWIEIECNIVTPHYFEVLGIPLLRGRGFSDQDRETTPGVVIINETMARRYWFGLDPLGKRIRVKGRVREQFEVIAVARDAKYRALSEDTKPYAYFPLNQRYYSTSTLHVKVAGDPRAMLAPIRRAIDRVNNDLIISDARPLSEHIALCLSQQHMAAALLGASGLLALILATIGIYGVVAFSVKQRTQEIGIRMALGARQGDILSLTFKEGFGLVLIGLGIGVPLAFVLSRFLASLIFGVGLLDPVTYVGTSLFLVVAASAASYVPARRAARVDPMVALRYE